MRRALARDRAASTPRSTCRSSPPGADSACGGAVDRWRLTVEGVVNPALGREHRHRWRHRPVNGACQSHPGRERHSEGRSVCAGGWGQSLSHACVALHMEDASYAAHVSVAAPEIVPSSSRAGPRIRPGSVPAPLDQSPCIDGCAQPPSASPFGIQPSLCTKSADGSRQVRCAGALLRTSEPHP